MSFFDKQFPTEISFGARGGPQESTNIVVLGSGSESRRARWSDAGGSWNVATGIKNDTDLHTLISFWRICRGSFRGFRFKDWQDYTSSIRNVAPTNADQNIGTGDGTKTSFQITKAYIFGGETILKTILKPVVGTVLVAVNGIAQVEGTDFLVDYSLGIIHFFVAPAIDLSVTVGFEFDNPARFKSDKLDVTGLTTKLSRAQVVDVIELKPLEVIGVDIDFTSMLTTVLPDSRLTLVRASQAGYFNSAGILKFALNDEPRPWHNHTAPFTHRGIMLEDARTIRITKNRDMTDAAWTAANMTVAKDAVGLDGVVNSASTLTASAANGTVTQSPTLGSLERTYSTWVKRVTGSGTVEISDDDFVASTVDITASINSSTFSKVEITSTRANPIIGIRVVTSGDAIEVDFNQLEDGDNSTSPIDSDIFTVRQADDLTFDDTSWINIAQGTVWIDCSVPDVRTGVQFGVLSIFDASSDQNRITFSKDSTTNLFQFGYNNGGVVAQLNDTKVWNADATRTFIADYEDADQRLFTDGTQEDTGTKTPVATGLDTVRLGRIGTVVPALARLNGFIERFRYIPVAGLGP